MENADLAQAVIDLRWLGARFKGLLALADVIDDYRSLERRIAEANTRLEEIGHEQEDAADAIRLAKEQADGEIAQKHAEANKQVGEKHANAVQIVADAQVEAKRIVDEARREAESQALRVEEHVTMIAQHDATLTSLKGEIEAHRTARDEAYREAEKVRAQLEHERNMLREFRAALPQ